MSNEKGSSPAYLSSAIVALEESVQQSLNNYINQLSLLDFPIVTDEQNEQTLKCTLPVLEELLNLLSSSSAVSAITSSSKHKKKDDHSSQLSHEQVQQLVQTVLNTLQQQQQESANSCGSTAVASSPDFIYLCLWSLFIVLSCKKRAALALSMTNNSNTTTSANENAAAIPVPKKEVLHEVKVTLHQLEFKIRELEKMKMSEQRKVCCFIGEQTEL